MGGYIKVLDVKDNERLSVRLGLVHELVNVSVVVKTGDDDIHVLDHSIYLFLVPIHEIVGVGFNVPIWSPLVQVALDNIRLVFFFVFFAKKLIFLIFYLNMKCDWRRGIWTFLSSNRYSLPFDDVDILSRLNSLQISLVLEPQPKMAILKIRIFFT